MYQTGEYRRENPTWHLEDSEWKAEKVAALLASSDIRPTSVVDLGCGVGGVLASLRDRGLAERFHGFDISPDAIAEARARHGSAIDFDIGTPSGTDRYSVSLVLDVLEHVHDPYALLACAREISDYVVVHIPLEISVSAALRPGAFLSTRESVGHINYYSQETALAMLRDAGLELLGSKLTAGAVELAGGGLKRKLAKPPRRLVAAIAPNVAARLLGGFSLLAVSRAPRRND